MTLMSRDWGHKNAGLWNKNEDVQKMAIFEDFENFKYSLV
jgi:hypothetical protein